MPLFRPTYDNTFWNCSLTYLRLKKKQCPRPPNPDLLDLLVSFLKHPKSLNQATRHCKTYRPNVFIRSLTAEGDPFTLMSNLLPSAT